MKEYNLILNTSFLSLNEYEKIVRGNKFAGAKYRKKIKNIVHYLATLLKFELPKNTKFDVHFQWFKPNNRKDHDNIAFAKKFIFDGLIQAKILEDDRPKFINNLSDSFEICKNRNYVSCIVCFTEVKK